MMMESSLDAPGSANVRVTSTGNVNNGDVGRCFVCDMVVTGSSKFYSLINCRSRKSKTHILDKLSQLVGDLYMVVVEEDDIICTGCAYMVNTLDRLECEIGSLRSVILRFLEKKYSMPEGELLNQKTTGGSQPPQIMPSSKQGSRNMPTPANFMARKRQAALQQLGISDGTDVQPEIVNHLNIPSKGSPADKWIQCNKCMYTTKLSTFKHHHLRSAENECEVTTPTPTPKADRQAKKTTGKPSQKKAGKLPKATPTVTEDASRNLHDSEIVGMIAASDYTAGQSADAAAVEPETIKVQIFSQGRAPSNRYGEKDVMIEMVEIFEESQGSNSVEVMANNESQICVMECVEEQMMTMNEANVGEDSNTLYVEMVLDGEEEMDVQRSSKQVLAVSDDGTVEMVEVMWNEMHARDAAAQESTTFQHHHL